MSIPTRTILVTGGLGYIGSHTVIELTQSLNQNKTTLPEANYKVLIIDNLSNSSTAIVPRMITILKNALRTENEDFFEFINCDVLNYSDLEKVFQDKLNTDAPVSHIIHFAAKKAVGESMHIPIQYFENNFVGSLNLLKCMEKFDCKNFIFSSSGTVYGNNPNCKEEDALMFASPYGCTKLVVEHMLKATAMAKKDWSVICLRYFNPCGAHESGIIGEAPSVHPNNLFPFIEEVVAGKRECLSIFGNDYDTHDGTGVRDYLHVVDLAKAHVCALNKHKDMKGSEVYNLGTGIGYSVLDILKAYSKVIGKEVPHKFVDRRAGDIDVSKACADKANKELGWKAEKTLDDMCADSYRWKQKNPNGFK